MSDTNETPEIVASEEDYDVADDVILLHRYFSAFSQRGLEDIEVDAVTQVTHVVNHALGRPHGDAVTLGSGFLMGWTIALQMVRDGITLKSMGEIIIDPDSPCPCDKEECDNTPEKNAELRKQIAEQRAANRVESAGVDALMAKMMDTMPPELRAIAEKIGTDGMRVAILKGSQLAEILQTDAGASGTGMYL